MKKCIPQFKNSVIKKIITLSQQLNLPRRNPRNAIPSRFLVVSTTGIGDTLWGTPAIRALKETYPECYIGVLINPLGVELLKQNPEVDELSTFAKKMGVGDRVVFHGFVPPGKLRLEVRKLNPVLIMPSLSSGRMDYVAHSKIYEYLSYGFPIVASDLSSVREVFLNINAAVLVKPNSAKDLADGIQWILQNQAEAKKLGMLAKELSKKYSWEERATSLSKIFGSISKQ